MSAPSGKAAGPKSGPCATRPNSDVRTEKGRQSTQADISSVSRGAGQPFPDPGSLRGEKRPAGGLGEKGGGLALIERSRPPVRREEWCQGRNGVREEWCQGGMVSGRNGVRGGMVSEEWCQEEWCQGGMVSGTLFLLSFLPEGFQEWTTTDPLVAGDQNQTLGPCRGANDPISGIPRVVVRKLCRQRGDLCR